jgi:hypothetical protein
VADLQSAFDNNYDALSSLIVDPENLKDAVPFRIGNSDPLILLRTLPQYPLSSGLQTFYVMNLRTKQASNISTYTSNEVPPVDPATIGLRQVVGSRQNLTEMLPYTPPSS